MTNEIFHGVGGWVVGGIPPLNQWGLNLEGYMKNSCSKCKEYDSKVIKDDKELEKRQEVATF